MNELLEKLVKTKKPTAPKQDRPTVDVPSNVLQSFTRLVGAKCVAEIAEARQEVEAEIVKSEMLDAFGETLYKHGAVPANPKLETSIAGRPDMSGIFQVQNRFKFNLPEGNEDLTDRLISALQMAGQDKDVAKDMVEKEIDTTPVVTLRPFNELVNGHYEGEGKNRTFVDATDKEKTVGQKLLEFVTGTSAEPLTEEERDIVLVHEENVKAKTGFLQRLKGYCANVDVLKGVLKVVTPTHFISHMKLGISDTPEERQQRLKGIAVELIGDWEE